MEVYRHTGEQVRHNPAMPPPVRLLLKLSLVLAAATVAPSLGAQAVGDTYKPASGDAWIDRHLADINLYATRYPGSFADEMTRYYAVPRGYVEAMLQQPDWSAGDIFYGCAVAQRVGQPCRALVREWSRDHEEGWAGVSERVGMKPGTPAFRALRDDIEASYVRWARPLID